MQAKLFDYLSYMERPVSHTQKRSQNYSQKIISK